MKKIYQHIILLSLFLLVSCGKSSNWTENYREKSKDPFGSYIIHNELENLFPDSEIVTLSENIYEKLSSAQDDKKANYICIKSNALKLNYDGVEQLVIHASRGNDAFLSVSYFNQAILERLNVSHKVLDEVYTNDGLKKLDGELTLKNKKFKKNKFYFNRNLRRNYFDSYDSDKTIVLGTQKINGKEEATFIKVYYGKGAIYLHSHPIAFTNYFLQKKENAQYAENVFSYLKESPTVYWDPQIKKSDYSDNSDNEREQDKKDSILKLFWQNPSLKWSLLVGFFGLIAFIVFNARRKQRAIPVIPKLQNSTVDFTHTIANLYYEENNPKNLVDKKITFFLQKIRANYLIDTTNLDERFIERLSAKSANDIKTTRHLINTIINLHDNTSSTQEDLEYLNTLIENFFEQEIKP